MESLNVNGKPHSKNYLTHELLMNGAVIDFKMSAEPNKKRGVGASDLPYSFSEKK